MMQLVICAQFFFHLNQKNVLESFFFFVILLSCIRNMISKQEIHQLLMFQGEFHKQYHNLSNYCFMCAITGFSFDSKSAVPDSYFMAGTPTFKENLIKLHSGTPTFLKKCPWDSYFENPSENLV